MGKLVKIIGCILIGIIFFSFFVSILTRCTEGKGGTQDNPPITSSPSDEEENGAGNEEEEDAVYTIVYYAVVKGNIAYIPAEAFKQDGNYPSGYLSSNGATVDDLNEKTSVTKLEDWYFYGWYLDEACTQAFDGTIESGTKGDIVLYAKIGRTYWTPCY